MNLTLPIAGRVNVRLKVRPERPSARAPRAPLFSEVLALFEDGFVEIEDHDVRDLALPDFHVLRAVLMKKGFVEEKEIEIACENCDEPMRVRPCDKLEIGPWLDGELGDPELDALDDDARRTVREAEPIFRGEEDVQEIADVFLASNYPLRLGAV